VTKAIVALGSNIRPRHNLPSGLTALTAHPAVTVLATSSLYETAPAGTGGGQPPFHNAAVLIDTPLDPASLRAVLRDIEAKHGRMRGTDRNAPRTLDLDVVAYEGFTGSIAGSQIPDPDLGVRPHVTVPAAEVAPDWALEPRGRTLLEVAGALRIDLKEIRPVTRELKPSIARYATEALMEPIEDEVYDAGEEARVRQTLLYLGEDPDREGLARTPLRVAKALDFLTSGYEMTLEEIVNNAIFESDADEMVVVKDIEFYSLCEHHMLPFFGKAAVAYLPRGRIIGLSKVARIVDMFSRRLQVQERLTNQIADAVAQALDPHGVAVIMEGSHFCMMMRGVQKQGSSMVTSAIRGGFRTDPRTRAEFFELINH
jgi:GTP cyclohydrolase I